MIEWKSWKQYANWIYSRLILLIFILTVMYPQLLPLLAALWISIKLYKKFWRNLWSPMVLFTVFIKLARLWTSKIINNLYLKGRSYLCFNYFQASSCFVYLGWVFWRTQLQEARYCPLSWTSNPLDPCRFPQETRWMVWFVQNRQRRQAP